MMESEIKSKFISAAVGVPSSVRKPTPALVDAAVWSPTNGMYQPATIHNFL